MLGFSHEYDYSIKQMNHHRLECLKNEQLALNYQTNLGWNQNKNDGLNLHGFNMTMEMWD
jgi:hypothetical protein